MHQSASASERLIMAKRYNEAGQWQHDRGVTLLDLGKPKPGDTALDIGCGTGSVTWELARRVLPSGKVVAIDPDADRLAFARASMPAAIAGNVTLIEASSEHLPDVEDTSIDLAFSNYALHWVPDKDQAMSEIRRSLRPGGRIVIEAVGTIATLLTELCAIAGEPGQRLLARLHFLDLEGWRALFERTGFMVDHIGWPELSYDFVDLETLVSWWEGTTHGDVLQRNMADTKMADLRSRYPDRVHFTAPSIQILAHKA